MIRYRILLIDDDDISNYITKRTLKKRDPDCEINIVANGEQALDYMLDCKGKPANPDLREVVLLDINMPVMNGFLFMNRFNQLPEEIRSRFKLLIFSSYVDIPVLRELKPLGIHAYLEKPLTPDKMDLYIFNTSHQTAV